MSALADKHGVGQRWDCTRDGVTSKNAVRRARGIGVEIARHNHRQAIGQTDKPLANEPSAFLPRCFANVVEVCVEMDVTASRAFVAKARPGCYAFDGCIPTLASDDFGSG